MSLFSKIPQSTQIVKGTDQYDRWVEIPQPLDFKVFIFNVTNPDEAQRGAQPVLKEIGPYVYS
jgi:lysosome membrane protein 2